MNPAPYPSFDGTQKCLDTDPELWFPATKTDTNRALKTLKAICQSCPFHQSCLDFAVTNAVEGVWGGTDDDERRSIRRRASRREPVYPATRDMVLRMAGRGRSVPLIAAHAGVTERSVRRILADHATAQVRL